MAYSFGRSVNESYFRDRNPDGEEGNIGATRRTEPPEYLELGFGWLNEYDRAGNYRPRDKRAEHLGASRSENTYGWGEMGASRKRDYKVNGIRKSSRTGFMEPLRSEDSGASQTDSSFGRVKNNRKRNPSGYPSPDYDVTTTRETGIRETVQEENPFGWKALGATRKAPLGTSEEGDLGHNAGAGLRDTVRPETMGETYVDNPFGWKALGPTVRTPSYTSDDNYRHTRRNDLRETAQSRILTETQTENPYGWRRLGRTQPPHVKATDVEVHFQAEDENHHGSTTEERLDEMEKSSVRRPRKRTFQESFSRGKRNGSGRYKQHISRSTDLVTPPSGQEAPTIERKILRPNRLSVLSEENTRERNLVENIEEGETMRKGLRATGGGDLRGTTYDYPYARKVRENVPEPVILKPASLLRPERRFAKNWSNPRAPVKPSTQWTNMATDQNLMGRWHSLFAKIKTKWSVDYNNPSFMSALSDTTSLGRVQYLRRHRKRWEVKTRTRLVLICAAVTIVLLVVILVPTVVLTTR